MPVNCDWKAAITPNLSILLSIYMPINYVFVDARCVVKGFSEFFYWVPILYKQNMLSYKDKVFWSLHACNITKPLLLEKLHHSKTIKLPAINLFSSGRIFMV